LQRDGITGKEIAALLNVCANCASVLNDVTLEPLLSSCINAAFDHLKRLGEGYFFGQEATSFSELIGALKLLCHHFRKESEELCDTMRLELICRMLKTPMFNTRMNGLKEVSRLIDESDRGHYQSGRKGIISISSQRLANWMAKNRVLSVAFRRSAH
jgi:ubiquitin carboxyl-terminal hydrolase 9/24